MKKFLAIAALVAVICSIGLVAAQFDPERWEWCNDYCMKTIPKPANILDWEKCMDDCMPPAS